MEHGKDLGFFSPLLICKHHTDLYSGLRQVDFQGHFLAHEDIRIARFSEQGLEHIELSPSECRSFPTLLSRSSCFQ